MKRICILTSIRSEYGLLKNLIQRIQDDSELELKLIVAGTHLCSMYGNSINQINEDGFEIADEISYLINGDRSGDRVKEIGMFMIQLTNSLERLKPDMIVLLGDRYETIGAAMAAMMLNIPIAHIAGGEKTEGAVDEQVRHAITKLAHLHFAEAEEYAQNICRMGEEKWRVFNVGALGIENINTIKYLSAEELKDSLGVEVDKETLLITYHPVTLENNQLQWQMDELIKALSKLSQKMIITYPNVDQGGTYIIDRIEAFAKDRKNVCLVKNLGVQRYLSVMKLCGAVVGNSSSALIEAPYLRVPVVNIGNRQKGRLMAENIISCSNNSDEIEESIYRALSKEFRERCMMTQSLYGEGKTSEEIIRIIKQLSDKEKLLMKKLMWDENE